MNIHAWWRCILLTSSASVLASLLTLFSSTDSSWTRRQEWTNQYVLHQSEQSISLQEEEEKEVNKPASSINSSLLLQEHRQRHLAKVCNELGLAPWTVERIREESRTTDTLFIDDRLRYIYCLVPKVACTTWTRVLLVAGRRVTQKNPNEIPWTEVNAYRYSGQKLRPMHSYGPKNLERRLRSYYKFMFVRHPLQRLVSAYRDRVHGHHKHPARSISKDILSKLLPEDEYKQRMRRKRVVTFPEFIRFVVDPKNSPDGANPHWRPQYHLCHPCHIPYDFIGHYETLRSDAKIVLDKLNASARVQFPVEDRDRRYKKGTQDVLEQMFQGIPPEHVEELKTRIYAVDYKMFEYK